MIYGSFVGEELRGHAAEGIRTLIMQGAVLENLRTFGADFSLGILSRLGGVEDGRKGGLFSMGIMSRREL